MLAAHSPDRPLLWDVSARASLGSCSDVRAWAASTHGVRMLVHDAATCADLAEERYRAMLAARKHDFMFIDFSIPRVGVRRIVIDIFTSVCPITCANFRSLCVGDKGAGAQTGAKLHYVGSPVHRVMHGGFFQAGDIVAGRGDQGESIYGGAFADETFDVRHSVRGMVGMAAGRAHANASQFYVTMRALPHLDTRCVAFGRVISGLGTLSLIDMAETKNQRPVQAIKIVASGVEHSASA